MAAAADGERDPMTIPWWRRLLNLFGRVGNVPPAFELAGGKARDGTHGKYDSRREAGGHEFSDRAHGIIPPEEAV
jgi:hypothetical protein